MTVHCGAGAYGMARTCLASAALSSIFYDAAAQTAAAAVRIACTVSALSARKLYAFLLLPCFPPSRGGLSPLKYRSFYRLMRMCQRYLRRTLTFLSRRSSASFALFRVPRASLYTVCVMACLFFFWRWRRRRRRKEEDGADSNSQAAGDSRNVNATSFEIDVLTEGGGHRCC